MVLSGMLHFNKFKFDKIFLFLCYDTTPIFSRLPKILCHCDDTKIAKFRKDDDVDDIYVMIKCVFFFCAHVGVCVFSVCVCVCVCVCHEK